MRSKALETDGEYFGRQIGKPILESEEDIQVTSVEWFRWQYPKKIIFGIANGGFKVHIRTAVRLKKLGTLAGIPDLFIPHPSKGFHGFFLETKSEKGDTSPEQKQMMPRLSEQGYCVHVYRSLVEFQQLVKWYFDTCPEPIE